APLHLPLLYRYSDIRDTHPYPTRRSSDLVVDHDQFFKRLMHLFLREFVDLFFADWVGRFDFAQVEWLEQEVFPDPPRGEKRVVRSEEHTSELQSHLNLVCRLLLEKKNHKQ